MVDVDNSSLRADAQPKSVGSVSRSVAEYEQWQEFHAISLSGGSPDRPIH